MRALLIGDHAARLKHRRARLGVVAGALLTAITACSGSGKHSTTGNTTVPATLATTTTSVAASGSSTTVAIQASGPRTVLSPVGLNVRSAPSKTASVLGAAAQGVTLTVLSHTDQGGGWYQVKGSTVTGYITDDPTLSAQGSFMAYSSDPLNFTLLYPNGWTPAPPGASSVVFHAPTASDSVVVTTAATAAQLPRGRTGYTQLSSGTAVICGVTGDLVTWQSGVAATGASTTVAGSAVAERYLLQIRLTLDATHAMAVEGNLADLAQAQLAKDVMYSLSFPFPQCEQGAVPSGASTTTPASVG